MQPLNSGPSEYGNTKPSSVAEKMLINYSHLSNKRGGWNRRGGSAKNAKLLNMEVGINVEGGIF